MSCRRFVVSGRVQGVFFRQSTQRVAKDLGLNGWCRNLPDGTVEVCACGDDAGIDQLSAWLRSGPRQARVDAVESFLVDPGTERHDDFAIRY